MKLAFIAVGLVFASVGSVSVADASSITKFSVDPASPVIGTITREGLITADDILRSGPAVRIPGTALGLRDDFRTGALDDLDALSFGRDPISAPLFFSVDRVTVGQLGTDVFRQALPGIASAAADVYVALPPNGSNRLVLNEVDLGLTRGFFGDDLNGLELDTEPGTIFFSIDALSLSNEFGALTFANDIFINVFPNIAYSGEAQIGLDPFDDIDALALDAGRNIALFSLSPFSPSTFTYTGNPYIPGRAGFLSPADILITHFDGSYSLFAPAGALGLRSDDNVDALDTVSTPALPSLVFLLGGAFVVLAWSRVRAVT